MRISSRYEERGETAVGCLRCTHFNGDTELIEPAVRSHGEELEGRPPYHFGVSVLIITSAASSEAPSKRVLFTNEGPTEGPRVTTGWPVEE